MRESTSASIVLNDAWRWWLLIGLLFLLVVSPGPEHSPFSGIPLSPHGVALFVTALIVCAFSAFFPPRARIGSATLLAVSGLVLLKVILSLGIVSPGWRAYYVTLANKEWTPVRFQGPFFTVKDHRIDREVGFDGRTWGLYFINDYSAGKERTPLPRDANRPMRVRWIGHVVAERERPFKTAIVATGTASVQIDGGETFAFDNPQLQLFERTLTPGAHTVVIEYDKPGGVTPLMILASPTIAVTPWPATPGEIERSQWRARAAVIVGFVALGLILIAVVRAYLPLSTLALSELWLYPGQLAAVMFFGYFTVVGLASIPQRAATVVLITGDDDLVYEAQARQVVFNGLLMTDERGAGATFHHYPLYSYALAAAHLVFGEDFASVVIFNHLCVAATGFAIFFLLRRYLTGPVTALALLAAALYLTAHQLPYARTAFSDNLYLPLVMTTLAVAVSALDSRWKWPIWAVGVLSALTAATRPSFVFFVPLFALAVLTDRKLGSRMVRLGQTLRYLVGFACGVAPFTIRNWIVAHRFVLIVSSFVMLPWFLYAPEEPVPTHRFSDDGRLLDSVRDFVTVWNERPREAAWVETRKILFTLGFMEYGPPVERPLPRTLVLWPIVFGAAVALGRIPRTPLRVLIVFAVSHAIAMVLGTPWTYGYKTILPLHLALLAGAAFLLPRWGQEWWRVRPSVARRLPPGRPTVSVVLPTYNEKDSIRGVIEDFFATGLVEEVVVVNNNAVSGTSEQVAETRAREIFESRQGYGAAIRRGLVEARGDLIVVCEPDGSFLARDIAKLLAFAHDFDVVYGSRTSQQLIWTGANMGLFLRWGNWAVAKYMQFLYNATNLTDVGCTLRLIHRDVAEALRDEFRVEGSQFGPEMMVLTLKHRYHVIQVPVNYLPRVGESAVTGDLAKAFALGLQMIWLITARRLERTHGKRVGATAPASIEGAQ